MLRLLLTALLLLGCASFSVVWRTATSLRLRSALAGTDASASAPVAGLQQLYDTLVGSMGVSESKSAYIVGVVSGVGIESTSELLSLARDFEHKPEVLSNVLQVDMKIKALDAHIIRSCCLHLLKCAASSEAARGPAPVSAPAADVALPPSTPRKRESSSSFNSVRLTSKAKGGKYSIDDIPASLSADLSAFARYMQDLGGSSQEGSIGKATAGTYLTHAKLFIGFHLSKDEVFASSGRAREGLTLRDIFPCASRESAQSVFRFIKWLRAERQISVSYEANVIRGLIKLCKFRYRDESATDPGEKTSFQDIPVIRELRKLHREAERLRQIAPRSSDEQKKWITWDEYLGVIRAVREELLLEIQDFRYSYGLGNETSPASGRSKSDDKALQSKRRKIAQDFQRYLILAFFADIPDRQRTMRELELGRTLLRGSDDQGNGFYYVKHGIGDYKTGRYFGDRPPLVISPSRTAEVDEFVDLWRPALSPRSERLFVQPRTGQPLTGDSVHSIVTRACFRVSGKVTNPHLLRDIIVTHVRETDASEKELEALALYMGHSIQMQRTSYDRRTLQQKVSPAVSLLRSLQTKQE